MDPSMNPWEKRCMYRSLLILVKTLENNLITVDLRNETSVSGKLVNVDGCMNLTFNDAAFVERPGSYKYFPTMFLPSRMIRDVIIPDDVSVTEAIMSLLPSNQKEREPRPKKPMTFKRKRALKHQAETLTLLRNAREQMAAASSSAS